MPVGSAPLVVNTTGQAVVTVSGLFADGQVGSVQVIGAAFVSVTGVSGAGQVGIVAVTTTGAILYWNGFWWQTYPMKVWDGTAWVQKPVRHWTGTSWE